MVKGAERYSIKSLPNPDSAHMNIITSHDSVQLVPLSKGHLLRLGVSNWMSWRARGGQS